MNRLMKFKELLNTIILIIITEPFTALLTLAASVILLFCNIPNQAVWKALVLTLAYACCVRDYNG